MFLFAAFGAVEFWERSARARFRAALAYAGLLFLATVFVHTQARSSFWALDSYNTGLQSLDLNHFRPLRNRELDLAYAYVPDNAELISPSETCIRSGPS